MIGLFCRWKNVVAAAASKDALLSHASAHCAKAARRRKAIGLFTDIPPHAFCLSRTS